MSDVRDPGAVDEPSAQGAPRPRGEVRLLDLFPLEDLQTMQDAFAAATGVASVITDTAGRPITRPTNFCRLCSEIIRGTPLGLASCMRSDAALGSPTAAGYQMRPCLSGGLLDGGTSLRVGDTHVGNWLIGQVLDPDVAPDRMVSYAVAIGADEAAFRGALSEVTRMPRAQFEAICRLLHVLGERLSSLALRNYQQAEELRHRQRTEAAAHDARDFLQKILEALPNPVFVKDEAHRWIVMNDAMCRLLGRDRAELIGRSDPEFFPPDEARVFWEVDDQVLSTGVDNTNRENLTDGAGVQRTIVTRKTRHVDGEGRKYVVGIIEDVTEQLRADAEHRALEAQVQHAQRLESLGVLAGGIAHDFNNLLVAILANSDLCLSDVPPESELAGALEDIRAAAKHASELTAQMLAYSGKGNLVVRTVDLDELLRETAQLLRISIRKQIDVRFELDGASPLIDADPSQIRQVVMNLLTNASDAIGEQPGEIWLRTGRCEVGERDLAALSFRAAAKPGRFAWVEVTDSGCGMRPDVISRIFDPFYTTKFAGRGLGLAAVLGIVRGHRGAIGVTSAPLGGTTFRVLFPCSDRSLDARPGSRTVGTAPPRGGGTVLVIDDDASVRKTALRILRRAGFEALEACDGVEGTELFRRHAGEICVVVLDLTMPRMTGRETFHVLRGLAPTVPIVLASGYDEDAVGSLSAQPNTRFLPKPFSPPSLVNVVLDALGATPIAPPVDGAPL